MSNIKISEMTEATSLGDSDLLTIVQGGVNKKITKTNAIGDIITALNNPTYTTDTGTSLNLTDTRVGRLKTTLKGDTSQKTITNLNRFNYTLAILISRNTSGTWSNNVYTYNAVTFTVNEDLTITVNGTASANTYFYLNARNDDYFKTLNGTTLRLTGTPSGGGNNSYQMTITSADWSNGSTDNGSGGQFTAIEDYYNNTYIKITSGYNAQNLLFKPMLSTTLTTTYADYVEPTAGQGSPSPDYPQDVQVVTGLNTIDIVGRNRIKINDIIWNGAGSNGLTYNLKDGVIRITGTAGSAGYSTYTLSSRVNFDELNKIPNGTKITFSVLDITGLGANQIFIGKTGQQYWMQPNATTKKATVTKDADLNYMAIWFQTTQGQVYDITIKPMLVVGETAFPFEPYKKQPFEINLGVENLLNTSTIQQTTSNGITCTYNMSTQEITFNGTCTTDNTNFNFVGTSINAINGKTTTTIFYVGGSISGFCSPRFLDSGFASGINMDILDLNNVKIKSETITTNADLVNNRIRFNNGSIANNFTIKVMISNNPSNTYCKYGTAPIELCKINDYQDYIHRVGTDWYIHKAIQNIHLDNVNYNGTYLFTNGMWVIKDKASNQTLKDCVKENNLKIYCNYLISKPTAKVMNDGEVGIVSNGGTGEVVVNFGITSSMADNMTFLENHNVKVYYPLATPNEILITEPSLINQLNALDYDGQSYYDVTNIMTEGQDLAPIITVEALEKI